MQIENETLLQEFRTPGPCEICCRFAPIREPHHVQTRGFGGGQRLDIRVNLVAVGSSLKKKGSGFRAFTCHCHKLAQAYKIETDFLVAIIAKREFVRKEEITEVMDFMNRIIRPTEWQLRAALEELSDGGRLLGVRELTEAGKLPALDAGEPL
jgi:hypothetical protein